MYNDNNFPYECLCQRFKNVVSNSTFTEKMRFLAAFE